MALVGRLVGGGLSLPQCHHRQVLRVTAPPEPVRCLADPVLVVVGQHRCPRVATRHLADFCCVGQVVDDALAGQTPGFDQFAMILLLAARNCAGKTESSLGFALARRMKTPSFSSISCCSASRKAMKSVI
jgi:hypothetical protein